MFRFGINFPAQGRANLFEVKVMKLNLLTRWLSLIIGCLLVFVWGGASSNERELYFYFHNIEENGVQKSRITPHTPGGGVFDLTNIKRCSFPPGDDGGRGTDPEKIQIGDGSNNDIFIIHAADDVPGTCTKPDSMSHTVVEAFTGTTKFVPGASGGYENPNYSFNQGRAHWAYDATDGTLITNQIWYDGRLWWKWNGTLKDTLGDDKFHIDLIMEWNSKPYVVIFSTNDPAERVPVKPIDLEATPGDGQATLDWKPQIYGIDIKKYQYQQKQDSGNFGAWEDMKGSDDSTTSYIVENLTNGHMYTFKIRAVNDKGDGVESDTASAELDSVPSFGTAIADQNFVVGQVITTLQLPTATGGNGALTHTLTPTTVPAGLRFDPATRQISGTPTTMTQNPIPFTWKAVDSDAITADTDAAIITFTIAVAQDTPPSFGTQTIEDKSYWPGLDVHTQLPAATGGNGTPLEYTLTPQLPDGLSFNASTRRILGDPKESAMQSAVQYTYKVHDADSNRADSDAATLTFNISVTEPPAEVAALIDQSMDLILSEKARIIGGEIMTGVRSRVQNFMGPQVGGNTGMGVNSSAVMSAGSSREPVRMDAQQFVYSDHFPALVNAFSEGGSARNTFSVWSDATHNQFENDDSALSYDGEVSGFSFGLDTPLDEDVIGGVALSQYSGEVDYQSSDGRKGTQQIKATSVSPYFGLRTSDYVMWSFVGIGSGDFEVDQGDYSESSDLSLNTVGIGASGEVWRDDKTELHLIGDFALTELSVDAAGLIPDKYVSVHRTRLVVEASQRHQSSDGGVFKPSAEVGVVIDSGDGVTGTRLEIGAGVNYLTPSQRLTLSLSSYGLVKRNSSSEWGVRGSIHMQPEAGEQGLSFSVRPSYGASVRSVDRIWDNGRSDDVAGQRRYRPRLEAGLSYGFRIAGDRITLKPYSEISMSGNNRTVRVGTRLGYDSKLEMSLLGEREESASDVESSLHLQGGIRF